MFDRRSLATITAALIAGAFAGAVQAVTSTFTTDAEGWTAQGDVQFPLTFSATGGNPGGHVFIDDLTTGGVTYFVAPAKFLGDKSVALGTSVTFDLRQVIVGSPNQFNDADVILQSPTLTLAFDTTPNPAFNAWTSYSVPLSAGAWRVGTLAGAAATPQQFESVLGNLTALKIRAEYQSGPDVGSLDNVAMVPEPGTYAMLLAGLATLIGLGALRTRRR